MVLECSKLDVPLEVAESSLLTADVFPVLAFLGFFWAGETGAGKNRMLSQATSEVVALFDLRYQISQ